MRREPRLQFTKEERENPALEKPIRKADRAAARADQGPGEGPQAESQAAHRGPGDRDRHGALTV